ncbi:MAG: hypothetical protein L7S67_10090 [Flavobacteriales bacterium]|nr:hypothetical protein [Flavobacteriales bacterium]
MRSRFTSIRTIGLLVLTGFSACSPEELVYENNPVPPYDGVPTVLVDAYLTRAFIDLIGREPLELELESERAALRAGALGMEARSNVVARLMGADPDYAPLYDRKLSDDLSGRFLDGFSQEAMDAELESLLDMATMDSLQGNTTGYLYNTWQAERMARLRGAIDSYRLGSINWREVSRRFCDNVTYDDLNMNSFNFINATFDDLFGRYPTEAEFEQAYAAVEFNSTSVVFGTAISNAAEYLQVLVANGEFDEGSVRWWAERLLVRPITDAEMVSWRQTVGTDVNIRALQQLLITSDEYADFL